jgi:hypothetical protein
MHKPISKNYVLVAILVVIGALLPMTVLASPDAIEYCKDKEVIARAAHIRDLSAPMWTDPKDAYKVIVLESDDINVFNLDKAMYITTGLMKLCQKDDEIVGLAAHEFYCHIIMGFKGVTKDPKTAYRIKVKDLEGQTSTLKIIADEAYVDLNGDRFAIKILGKFGLDPNSYLSLLQRLEKLPNQEKVTLAKWNPPYAEREKCVQETINMLMANLRICALSKVLSAKQFCNAINGTPIAKYGFVCVDKRTGLYIFFNSTDKAVVEKNKITLPTDATKAVFYVQSADMPKDCKLLSTLIEMEGLEISDGINDVGIAFEIPLAYLSEDTFMKVTDTYSDKRDKEKKIETVFELCIKNKVAENTKSDFAALREPKINNLCAPEKVH